MTFTAFDIIFIVSVYMQRVLSFCNVGFRDLSASSFEHVTAWQLPSSECHWEGENVEADMTVCVS